LHAIEEQIAERQGLTGIAVNLALWRQYITARTIEILSRSLL
jgi:hypothetical protein